MNTEEIRGFLSRQCFKIRCLERELGFEVRGIDHWLRGRRKMSGDEMDRIIKYFRELEQGCMRARLGLGDGTAESVETPVAEDWGRVRGHHIDLDDMSAPDIRILERVADGLRRGCSREILEQGLEAWEQAQ